MGDGLPKFFSDFSFTTPFVLREFTETLRTFVQFGLGGKEKIFPIKDELKNLQRQSFDTNIFHDGEVVMDEVSGQKKMLLAVDGMKIPFMAWSTGQKEFMPLLLAFYCLSDSPSKVIKRDNYTTVIIEEPEMGLHPKAIVSVLLQIIELMIGAGYQVIVSTHSSIFLEFAWAFNTLKGHTEHLHEAVCEMFEVEPKSSVGKILKQIEEKSVKTYYFSRKQDGKVRAEDISSLDVISEDTSLSEWGGISEFAARMNNIVSDYID